MRILVAGGRGQLGRRLARDPDVTALDLDTLDIRDHAAVDRVLEAPFDAVINAAAYTAVDRAESERSRAYEVNRDGAGILARACAQRGVRFLHVSTDFVFDGTATRPYREDAPTAPLQVYGETKLDGEHAVLEAGGTVVRTSWLFGEGGPSFVHAILRQARDKPVLRVVADQRGCPTYAGHLADALLALAARSESGVFHYCGDDATTWHGFATAIVEEARKHTTIACERIEPITTADYPTPAKRPAYTVLDTSKIRALGIAVGAWRVGLARVIAEDGPT